MATNWTEGVLHNSPSKLAERLVLLLIADSAGRDSGECWHSVETLSRLTNLGESTVHRCLKSLAANGEITITQNGSRWRTNVYQMNPKYDGKEGPNLRGSQFERVPNRESEGPNLGPRTVIEPLDTKNTRAKKILIPENWTPDEEGVAYAKEHGVPKSQVEKFIRYYRSKGTRFADISEAWKSWCLGYDPAKNPRDQKQDRPDVEAAEYRHDLVF